jgi:transcriptional regulator of aromatic amino acid metabolism
MRHVLAKAARVAPREMTILITGEAGVGKERLARWIHAESRRADRPFVPVDCGAFPDPSVDNYLSEHLRGACRGIVRGIFDAAGGGTLFLDDIGDSGGGSPRTDTAGLRVQVVAGHGAFRRRGIPQGSRAGVHPRHASAAPRQPPPGRSGAGDISVDTQTPVTSAC